MPRKKKTPGKSATPKKSGQKKSKKQSPKSPGEAAEQQRVLRTFSDQVESTTGEEEEEVSVQPPKSKANMSSPHVVRTTPRKSQVPVDQRNWVESYPPAVPASTEEGGATSRESSVSNVSSSQGSNNTNNNNDPSLTVASTREATRKALARGNDSLMRRVFHNPDGSLKAINANPTPENGNEGHVAFRSTWASDSLKAANPSAEMVNVRDERESDEDRAERAAAWRYQAKGGVTPENSNLIVEEGAEERLDRGRMPANFNRPLGKEIDGLIANAVAKASSGQGQPGYGTNMIEEEEDRMTVAEALAHMTEIDALQRSNLPLYTGSMADSFYAKTPVARETLATHVANAAHAANAVNAANESRRQSAYQQEYMSANPTHGSNAQGYQQEYMSPNTTQGSTAQERFHSAAEVYEAQGSQGSAPRMDAGVYPDNVDPELSMQDDERFGRRPPVQDKIWFTPSPFKSPPVYNRNDISTAQAAPTYMATSYERGVSPAGKKSFDMAMEEDRLAAEGGKRKPMDHGGKPKKVAKAARMSSGNGGSGAFEQPSLFSRLEAQSGLSADGGHTSGGGRPLEGDADMGTEGEDHRSGRDSPRFL